MNDTISLLMNHRSIRKFKDQLITEEQLRTIVSAAQMASTSSNVQAYTVIAATDPELKKDWRSWRGTRLTWSNARYFSSGAPIYAGSSR